MSFRRGKKTCSPIRHRSVDKVYDLISGYMLRYSMKVDLLLSNACLEGDFSIFFHIRISIVLFVVCEILQGS